MTLVKILVQVMKRLSKVQDVKEKKESVLLFWNKNVVWFLSILGLKNYYIFFLLYS